MKRTKTCGWCECYEISEHPFKKGVCRFNPEPYSKWPQEHCSRFQWNEEAMQEMLKESEAAVKESMDFSSKGKT